MMRRGQITMALVVVGMLSAVVFPWTLGAQELDCRTKACEVEDIVKTLQAPPMATSQPPMGTLRGLPTTTMSIAAISMPAVALNVYFATNSDRIAPEYHAELNKLGKALTQLQSPVEISGHTDSIGSAQANQLLSERRARSVKQYLAQHFSLPAERLIAKGYGKSRPRDTNDTESGRRQNRRIEVALLKQ